MTDALTLDTLPTSFGVFKPDGHLMIGLHTGAQADAVRGALRAQGWSSESLLDLAPAEAVTTFEAMLDNAGVLASFGYEITLLRRYLQLARDGQRWLLVKVDDAERAAQAAEIARARGATLAVHYRLLATEDLI
jgi:hypothetical protein